MTKRVIDPSLIRRMHLFRPLSNQEIRDMITGPDNAVVKYREGDIILRKGDPGDCMYVILEGKVDVLLTGRGRAGMGMISVATLQTGDYFGEQSLLPGGYGRRNATVRAREACELLRIQKHYVDKNLSEEVDTTITDITMVELPQDKKVLGVLEHMRLFKSLKPDELVSFRDWTEIAEYPENCMITRESQPGTCLYVVLEGRVKLFVEDEQGEEIQIATLGYGNYFGEFSLIPEYAGKRNTQVRSIGPCRVLKVAKDYFLKFLRRDPLLYQAIATVGKSQISKLNWRRRKGDSRPNSNSK